ncbi:Hint domain-containing protein [Jannaschia marina]|uniref:Hint domain-containing protein n=1 Tax=Jannaschia marina TaxID=2741674 RepID=UPI0015CBF556|nr:Hint domain-containing protein [Jannaschia marina]
MTPAFLTLTDADLENESLFDTVDLGPDSTIDLTQLRETIEVTLTGTSITFRDTATPDTPPLTFTDGDLQSGSFSNIVQFLGNDGGSTVSGASGLDGQGYVGGDGDDTFTDDGTIGGQLRGGGGNDRITGGTGSNEIDGGDGDDTLSGNAGNNNLTGGDGDDVLFGDTGSGNLLGGDGDDIIVASRNTSFIDGGSGTNTLFLPEDAVVTPFSPTGGTVSIPGGSTFTYLNIGTVTTAPPPCFTAGTLIRTPSGEVPVENLRPGDLVETLDRGARPLRWVGGRSVPGRGRLAPIVFAAGALGNRRRLRVSPQHRMLLRGWRAELHFGTDEVLAAAAHLVNGDTIARTPVAEVAYVHLMFDDHEIVAAEGCWSESFHPGRLSLDGLAMAARDELLSLFPELCDPAILDRRPAARPCLKRREARLFADRGPSV